MKKTLAAPAPTPVPWTVECDDSTWGGYIVVEAQRQLFSMEEREDSLAPLEEIDQGNGRFIERACNSHQDLIDALLVAENAIRGVQMYETPGSGEYQQHQWVIDVIHTALNKAYGNAE